MRLLGGVSGYQGPASRVLASTSGNRPTTLISRGPFESYPVVAEIVTLPTVRIHDLLDVVYLPCRFRTWGIQNLTSGKASEISVTSTTVGGKTCAIVPYLDAPGPQISLSGFCVCSACLTLSPRLAAIEAKEGRFSTFRTSTFQLFEIWTNYWPIFTKIEIPL